MRHQLIISFVLATLACRGNDSTLYQKRIEKIKGVYDWLAKRPFEPVNVFKADTNHVNWQSYDTALTKFFARPTLDSLFENRGERDDILSPAAKFQLLKQFIAGFHELTKKQCFTDLKFKQTEPEAGTSLSKEDSAYFDNSIVQYFLVDGQKFELIEFSFGDRSTALLGMSILQIFEPEYKVFRVFYENLKPCSR